MSHRTIIFAKNLMTLRTLHEMTQQELADKPNSEGRIIRNGGTPFFFGNILPLVPLNVIVLYIISEQILKPKS